MLRALIVAAIFVVGCSKPTDVSEIEGPSGTPRHPDLLTMPISSSDLLAKLRAKGYTIDVEKMPRALPNTTHYVVNDTGARITFNESNGQFHFMMMRTIQVGDNTQDERTQKFIKDLTMIVLGIDAAKADTVMTMAMNNAPLDEQNNPRYFFGVANTRATVHVSRNQTARSRPLLDFTFTPSK